MKTYGPMTVERHRELSLAGTHLHVFVAGVDVTARCFFWDDTPGQERASLSAPIAGLA